MKFSGFLRSAPTRFRLQRPFFPELQECGQSSVASQYKSMWTRNGMDDSVLLQLFKGKTALVCAFFSPVFSSVCVCAVLVPIPPPEELEHSTHFDTGKKYIHQYKVDKRVNIHVGTLSRTKCWHEFNAKCGPLLAKTKTEKHIPGRFGFDTPVPVEAAADGREASRE